MSAPSTGVQRSPQTRRSIGWRVRHSAWLLAPILGVGVFSCVGFIYCAVRVKTRRWTTVAVVATLASILSVVLDSVWQDSASNPSNAAISFMLMLWLASIVFGFVINRDYLGWRSSR
jgi:hypothetical protein